MGMSLEQAIALGIGHEHPDHPDFKGKRPAPPIPESAGTVRPAPKPRAMNKTEARMDRILACFKASGAIEDYRYESIKFRLATKTWYTPDFAVVMNNHILAIIEVKGAFVREDGIQKTRIAAETYPFAFIMAQWNHKRWDVIRQMPGPAAESPLLGMFDRFLRGEDV